MSARVPRALRRLLLVSTALALVPGALAAPTSSPTAADVARPVACERWLATPRKVGVAPPELNELSGLAASRTHPGIYWAHNDSGNAFVLYALRENGTIVARFPLRGAAGRDPEDIAVGPCAAGSHRWCVYVGDIGDNGKNRRTVEIVKVPEPATLQSRPLAVEVLPFRYVDGPRNAEALLVDPRSARLFVISKTLMSLGTLYRLDGLGSRGGGTARRVRDLRMPKDFDSYTTAADVHPLGDRILLRTYGRVWELRSPAARTLEDVFDGDPVEVPGAPQPQAEAIAWSADGRSYLLGSETAGSPLYRVDCAEP